MLLGGISKSRPGRLLTLGQTLLSVFSYIYFRMFEWFTPEEFTRPLQSDGISEFQFNALSAVSNSTTEIVVYFLAWVLCFVVQLLGLREYLVRLLLMGEGS